jgi:hypothetical protein
LTAQVVAAKTSDESFKALESWTAPHARVVAGQTERVGVVPPVLARGAETDRAVRAVPDVALVIRPCASTVSVGFVYVFALTPVEERAIVPEVVIEPPVSPVPAVILVTVPLRVFVTVTEPELPDRLIPEPAFSPVTPVLLTTTLPVFVFTAIPDPANTPVTDPPPPPPVEQMYAVVLLTQRPVPTMKGRYGPQIYHSWG